MLAEERIRKILTLLEEKKAVSVADLCQETGASEATIRRDLNELDRQGKLSKVHGGAVLPKDEFQSQEPDILTKSQLNVEQSSASRAMPPLRSTTTTLSLSTRAPPPADG